jgi:cytochrome c-type biogenesis protein CcmH/NrfG
VWTSLAGAYRAEQRDADSQAALAKARELDPLNDALLRIDARAK